MALCENARQTDLQISKRIELLRGFTHKPPQNLDRWGSTPRSPGHHLLKISESASRIAVMQNLKLRHSMLQLETYLNWKLWCFMQI